jgi:plasmid replication initiation protein
MKESSRVSDVDHQQLQLHFDSPLIGKIKNDRTVMVFNFFSLKREKETELTIYDDGHTRIEVVGTKYGVANIWDKELLIYVASLIQDRINRNEPIGRRVTFTAHDYFRACGGGAGGSAYDRLEESLQRLQTTRVRTNIETGGEGEDRAFVWVPDYKLEYSRRGRTGEKRLKAVVVEICEWLFRAIVKDQRMLTYHHRFFELGPMERRLYEIARAHCGQQNGFRMNIEKLRSRVGSDMPLKNFKKRLLDILASSPQPLPEYGFIVFDPQQAGKGTPNRVPLKRLQVYFYRSDNRGIPAIAAAPLLDD